MVIPRKSDFRKNIDWIDNNYPREVGSSQTLRAWFFLLYKYLTSKIIMDYIIKGLINEQ